MPSFLVRAGGISLFAATKNSGAVAAKLVSPNGLAGYALVFLNLGMDAFTNAYQDTVRAPVPCCVRASDASQVVERYPKTTPQQLMFYMNAWCTGYYALYFFGFTSAWQMRVLDCAACLRGFGLADAGVEAVAFCLAHAEAARQVMLYCICGAAGQARLTFGMPVFAPHTYKQWHLRISYFSQSPITDRW